MRFFLLLTMALLFSSSVKGNHDEVEDFWSIEAQRLDWFHPWNQVLDWKPPYAEWFLGGKLNACYNCIDRHMHTKIRTKTALIWEGEEGDVRSFTYEDLYNEINRFSNVLKSKGIQKGDVVVIYLPMIPEAVIAMLSCARIGAIHNVVFAGFSAEALKGRIMDSEAKAVITADGGRRRGKIIPLKEITNLALKDSPSVKNVVVVKHVNQPINMQDGRDYWYDRLMQKAEKLCPVEEMDSEDPLFILYTSGSTGKPKGIVHATGGYMVAVSSTMNFMRNSKPADLFFSLGDIGWLSGHTAVVYGPLSNGDSHLIYEGAVDYPEKDRVWKLIEKYKVTSFSTSPTGIRTFMKWGDEWVRKWDLSSLRLLSSAGEPLNPEAWNWYYTQVGKKKCPILDSWGQTETGAAMISSVLNTSKPGSSGSPLPGMNIKIVDDKGNFSNKGHVVITTPWPSMLRGIYKDPQRYEETYWKKLNGSYCYFTGDEAQVDNEGDFYFMGRSDDVINISGHRLSTMELESAFTSYLDVVEAAVIDIPHEIKGSALIAFVTLKEGLAFEKKMEELLKDHISHEIGAIARPDRVIFTRDLPKTRTGKIMRRLLRDIALGKVLGDTTTLLDSSVIALIQKQYEELD